MKRLALVIVFLILNINISAQNDTISASNELNSFFELISYRGGVGLFIPASNQNFRVAALLEFNMNIPTSNVNSIEFAIQFGGWDREDNFTYVKRQDTFRATARMFFNGLLKFKRDIVFFDKSFIGVGAGVGYSAIFINTDVIEQDTEERIKPYKSMTSFLLSPELEYLFNLTDKTQFSISFSVQYVTYKLKVALENDIGKWFFLPKVTCRF